MERRHVQRLRCRCRERQLGCERMWGSHKTQVENQDHERPSEPFWGIWVSPCQWGSESLIKQAINEILRQGGGKCQATGAQWCSPLHQLLSLSQIVHCSLPSILPFSSISHSCFHLAKSIFVKHWRKQSICHWMMHKAQAQFRRTLIRNWCYFRQLVKA